MLPKVTLYVPDEDQSLLDRARGDGEESLSAIFRQALRERATWKARESINVPTLSEETVAALHENFPEIKTDWVRGRCPRCGCVMPTPRGEAATSVDGIRGWVCSIKCMVEWMNAAVTAGMPEDHVMMEKPRVAPWM